MPSKLLRMTLGLTLSLFALSSHAMYADGVKKYAGIHFENISEPLQLSPEQMTRIQKICDSYEIRIQKERAHLVTIRAHIEAMYEKNTPPAKQNIQAHVRHMQHIIGKLLTLRLEERAQVEQQLSSKQRKDLTQRIHAWSSEHPKDFSEI